MKKLCFVLLSSILIIGSSVAGEMHFIAISDTGGFYPTELHISQRDTVRWVSTSGNHQIVSDSLSPKYFVSDTITPYNEVFDVVFGIDDVPSPYTYHCGSHPSGE